MIQKESLELANKLFEIMLSTGVNKTAAQVLDNPGEADKVITSLVCPLGCVKIQHIGKIAKDTYPGTTCHTVPILNQWNEVSAGVIKGPVAIDKTGADTSYLNCRYMCTFDDTKYAMSLNQFCKNAKPIIVTRDRDFYFLEESDGAYKAKWMSSSSIMPNVVTRLSPPILDALKLIRDTGDPNCSVNFTQAITNRAFKFMHVTIPSKHITISWLLPQVKNVDRFETGGKVYSLVGIQGADFKELKEENSMNVGSISLDDLDRNDSIQQPVEVKEDIPVAPKKEVKVDIENKIQQGLAAKAAGDTEKMEEVKEEIKQVVEGAEEEVEKTPSEMIDSILAGFDNIVTIAKAAVKETKTLAKAVKKSAKKAEDPGKIAELEAKVDKLQKMLKAAMD